MSRRKIILPQLFLVLLATLFSVPALHAQRPSRNRVVITCSCPDQTGRAYVQALHDALARNTHYQEVTVSEAFAPETIRINIVSLPLETGSDGIHKAALSIVCLHDGAILHQFIETCTRIPIEDCAQSVLDDLLKWEADSQAFSL